MLNIFFISNDVRVVRLIEYFQPRFRSKIRWADNFDHGLKEVFENRPSLVFIQHSINSVSGETVARHIKSLLGSASPKIVYLDETGAKTKKNAIWYDEWMRMAAPEQQFHDEFASVVASLYPDDWKEEIIDAACVHSDTFKDLPEAASLTIADAGDGDLKKRQSDVATVGNRKFAGKTPLAELPEGAGNGLAGESVVPVLSGTDDKYAGADVGTRNGRHEQGRLRRALLLTALMAAVAGVVYFLLIRENTVSLPSRPGPEVAGKPMPAGQVDRDKLRRMKREGLPSFIRSEWQDQSYSSQHPGWERYASPQLDFRIFRNGGMMKALQIIAVEGEALSDSYLSSVFRELGYPAFAKDGKGMAKDGFLMEKIMLDDSSEVVTYRESDGRSIRALVIVFP